MRYLKNSWVILSTAIAIIIAGALVFQVLGLDRFFEKEYEALPPAPSTPGSYSAEHVDDPCAGFDLQVYENAVGMAPETIPGDVTCRIGFSSGGLEPTFHQMMITVSILEDIETAAAVFEPEVDRVLNDSDRTPVDGSWEGAVSGVDDDGALVLMCYDENLQLRISQTMNPPDVLTDDDALELATVYAAQALDSYRS